MNYAKYINLLTSVWAIKPSTGHSIAMMAERIFFGKSELSISEKKSLIEQAFKSIEKTQTMLNQSTNYYTTPIDNTRMSNSERDYQEMLQRMKDW